MRRRDKQLTTNCRRLAGAEGPTLEIPGGDMQVETRSSCARVVRCSAIRHDEAQLTFDDADSLVWQSRLTEARPAPRPGDPGGGPDRGRGSRPWLARHGLARRRRDDRDQPARGRRVRSRRRNTFVFRQGLSGGDMLASIDLLEELDREDSLTFELHRSSSHRGLRDGPDLAFLRVEQIGGDPRRPRSPWRSRCSLRLRRRDRLPGARQPDPRGGPDGPDLRQRLRQEAARARPGDGSPRDTPAPRLLDPRRQLRIGPALARDRRGRRPALRGPFLQSNFAVPSRLVARRLDDLRSGPPLRPQRPRVGRARLAPRPPPLTPGLRRPSASWSRCRSPS